MLLLAGSAFSSEMAILVGEKSILLAVSSSLQGPEKSLLCSGALEPGRASDEPQR